MDELIKQELKAYIQGSDDIPAEKYYSWYDRTPSDDECTPSPSSELLVQTLPATSPDKKISYKNKYESEPPVQTLPATSPKPPPTHSDRDWE